MKSDDRPDETIDSGMGTLQSRGTGPALESMLPDPMMDRGIMYLCIFFGIFYYFYIIHVLCFTSCIAFLYIVEV